MGGDKSDVIMTSSINQEILDDDCFVLDEFDASRNFEGFRYISPAILLQSACSIIHFYLDKHVEIFLLWSPRNSSNCRSSSDAIAEPLYALIGEVFDMRGVFKLLRKSLMTFVQITYGR